MQLLLISVVLLGLCFLGIAIKIVLKKEGRFSGTCASQSPFLNKEGKPCSLCGKLPEKQNCETPRVSQNR